MSLNTTNPLSVTVLTGFLGSGKTTLLNRIVRAEHGLRIGVLVNDFGEINIDAAMVTAMDGQMIDLSNGCVCCTMQGDLVTSVRKLLAHEQRPDHLIIEASGISDPVGIIAAFRTPTLREATRLHAVVAVVDAMHARDPRLDRQLVEDQIRSADVIALNKIDLVDAAQVTDVRAWLLAIAPRAVVVETSYADLPLDVLFDLRTAARSEVNTRHVGAHRFRSVVYTNELPLSYRRVREALEDLPTGVFRAKGFLYLADAPLLRFVAQRVGRRVTLDVSGRWDEQLPVTQLVLIGDPAAVDAELLTAHFDVCRTDAVPLLPADNFCALRSRLEARRLERIPPPLATAGGNRSRR